MNDLFETRNFGIKTFEEIAEIMQKYGISFKNEEIYVSFIIKGETYKEILAIMKEYGLYHQKENDGVEDNTDLSEDYKKTVLSDTPIDKCNLSNQSMNCLLKAGIKTIGDLNKITRKELKNIEGVGKKAFDEIAYIMEKYGISFKIEEDEQSKQDIIARLLKQDTIYKMTLNQIEQKLRNNNHIERYPK